MALRDGVETRTPVDKKLCQPGMVKFPAKIRAKVTIWYRSRINRSVTNELKKVGA